VKSTKDMLSRAGMVVLNETVGDSKLSEFCLVITLQEKAARVFQDSGLQHAHAGKRCLYSNE